jgi:lipase ATG15
VRALNACQLRTTAFPNRSHSFVPLCSFQTDFAFLAGLAYRSENLTQSQLDGWFQGEAEDRQDVVTQWRTTVNNSQVSMKLISFPGQSNFSYVSSTWSCTPRCFVSSLFVCLISLAHRYVHCQVRGTTNSWDALTDAQLWSGAILMQILRFFLPAGEVWTPIIDRLIYVLSYLQSASIDEVSFYRDTTSFVKYLQNRSSEYPGLAITGHSLGGGLAMISGAQTGTPAVAMSGPNAMLSKRSFIPEITKEDLDSKTFNVIPSM